MQTNIIVRSIAICFLMLCACWSTQSLQGNVPTRHTMEVNRLAAICWISSAANSWRSPRGFHGNIGTSSHSGCFRHFRKHPFFYGNPHFFLAGRFHHHCGNVSSLFLSLYFMVNHTIYGNMAPQKENREIVVFRLEISNFQQLQADRSALRLYNFVTTICGEKTHFNKLICRRAGPRMDVLIIEPIQKSL